jgi:large conductance mechanosensitive channel
MPRLSEDDVEELHDEAEDLLESGERHAKRLFAGFVDFAFSGNILEIAFGLM